MQIQDFLSQNETERSKHVTNEDFNLGGIGRDQLTSCHGDVNSCELLLNTMYSFSISELVKETTLMQVSADSVRLAFVSLELTPDVSVEDGIFINKCFSLHLLSAIRMPVATIIFKGSSHVV